MHPAATAAIRWAAANPAHCAARPLRTAKPASAATANRAPHDVGPAGKRTFCFQLPFRRAGPAHPNLDVACSPPHLLLSLWTVARRCVDGVIGGGRLYGDHGGRHGGCCGSAPLCCRLLDGHPASGLPGGHCVRWRWPGAAEPHRLHRGHPISSGHWWRRRQGGGARHCDHGGGSIPARFDVCRGAAGSGHRRARRRLPRRTCHPASLFLDRRGRPPPLRRRSPPSSWPQPRTTAAVPPRDAVGGVSGWWVPPARPSPAGCPRHVNATPVLSTSARCRGARAGR